MHFLKPAFLAVAITILTACGGGGGSGSTQAGGTLGGVAAVGAPIVNGTISIICAGGSPLSTTTSNTGTGGAWQVTLSGQTLPCAVEVNGGAANGVANTVRYHAIATTSGTVNVTPLSDLMVANMAGASDPAAWFAGLPPATLAAINQPQVDAALTNLRAALPGLGPLAGINPVTTPFTPVAGNVIDDMLSSLQAAMDAGGGTVTYASLLHSAASAYTVAPAAGFGATLASAYKRTLSAAAPVAYYTIGGTVTGLVGSVVLKDNGGDDLALTANGSFSFATQIANISPYNVTVDTQPSGQTCSVSGGAGAVSGVNVTDVMVVCSAAAYSVSGSISTPGEIVLQDNNGDNLIATSGVFAFSAPVADGSPYSVSMLTGQPPGQRCTIANGTGAISGVNVTNVAVTCGMESFYIGGTVSGVSGSVVLQDNGGGDLTLTQDAAFAFASAVQFGNPYNVSVSVQPAGQTCIVTGGNDMAVANVSSVAVTCTSEVAPTANPIGVAGSNTSGQSARSLYLQSTLGTLSPTSYSNISSSLSDYAGMGSAASVPYSATSASSGYGTLTADGAGNLWAVQNNDQSITGWQTSTAIVKFPNAAANPSALAPAIVITLPAAISVNSMAFDNSGDLWLDEIDLNDSGEQIVEYTAASSYAAAGTVIPYSGGGGAAGGCEGASLAFGFDGHLQALENYYNGAGGCSTRLVEYAPAGNAVTSKYYPAGYSGNWGRLAVDTSNNLWIIAEPNCSSLPGSSCPAPGYIYEASSAGSLLQTIPLPSNLVKLEASSPVSDANGNLWFVGVSTTSNKYTIGGTVTGLTGTVVLQDNGGNNIAVSANGPFNFAKTFANGSPYNVTVLTQPKGQTCSVSTGLGMVTGNNVTNVAVVCSANTYSVGGSVSGLTGSVVVLRLNNYTTILTATTANGALTLAPQLADGSPYVVSVQQQPVGQSCSVANGTGAISASNVSNVAITCAANTYTVGGKITGLNGSVVLQNGNGGGSLAVSANGSFTFPYAVAGGSAINVTVSVQPSGETCRVTGGSGTATANVTAVAVSCSASAIAFIPDLVSSCTDTYTNYLYEIPSGTTIPLVASAYTQNCPAPTIPLTLFTGIAITPNPVVVAPNGYATKGGLTWMPVMFADTWPNASSFCASFNGSGTSSWRLPTQAELSALYALGGGAMYGGWTSVGTWSSTPSSSGSHDAVYLNNGVVSSVNDTNYNWVSCVY